MKTRNLIVALSLSVVASGAFAAQPVHEPNNTSFQGVYRQSEVNAPTRAEVVAALRQAKANGQVAFDEQGDQSNTLVASTLTRADVRKEIAQAGGPAIAFGEETNLM